MPPFPLALLATAVTAGVVGWEVSQLSGGSGQTSPVAAAVERRQIVARVVPKLPHGWSYTAQPRSSRLTVFRAPGSRRTLTVLSARNPAGAPLTVLVRRAAGPWLQVLLPMRPNGVRGWVPLRAVQLQTTAYGLWVDLKSHRLRVLVANHLMRRFRIAVGRAVTPTPSGRYFITELLAQPNRNGPYGPYAFGLSAYSGALSHFGRGGDGQIGIHGTNHPVTIGRDVSHGCIRMRNADIVWLAHRIPLGTPVLIGRG